MSNNNISERKKTKKLRPLFKIHGGKSYLHTWIINFLPENYTDLEYLEPYAGAASVLLNKLPSKEEIINDIDSGVANLLRIIRDQTEEFLDIIKTISYCKKNFNLALEKKEFTNELEEAVNEFIIRRMSRGGLKETFAWSDRLRGGQPGEINAWKTIIKSIPVIAERLKDVFITNKPAIRVIKAFDDINCLAYIDPPYLHETRVSTQAYQFEMSTADHVELAGVLNNFKGKVIISGYASSLYEKLYKNWRCENKQIANHSSQQKIKPIKTECLWLNY